jgi:hypothetical protein
MYFRITSRISCFIIGRKSGAPVVTRSWASRIFSLSLASTAVFFGGRPKNRSSRFMPTS